jgi:hypothetical protein
MKKTMRINLDPVRGDGLLHHRDRPLGRLTRRDVGGDGVTGVVVDELEDHACPAAGEDVVGRVQLPARVRGGIDESSVGGPRLLPRLGPGDVRVAEDSRQRRGRGNRGHSQVAHLNLAGAYESAGRIDEAIPLYEQNLADYVRVLGPDQPQTVTARNTLAGAYETARRLGEEQGVDIR